MRFVSRRKWIIAHTTRGIRHPSQFSCAVVFTRREPGRRQVHCALNALRWPASHKPQSTTMPTRDFECQQRRSLSFTWQTMMRGPTFCDVMRSLKFKAALLALALIACPTVYGASDSLSVLLSRFQTTSDVVSKEAVLRNITIDFPNAGPELLKIAAKTRTTIPGGWPFVGSGS